ncbi:hypothetical protein BKK81_06610 [Cupriavidus sp. USMAHM13]|uniref:Membrane associated, exported and processed into extracellular protein EXP n=1 Tax=Cupriavidus malaysiensis TaxID=367825 RepID=A0ABN4TKJ5_9BURK|nr:MULTISPECIES: hypothetical protein [Cupriavidus]AOY98966.1 hypothetical protein BKK81_06610 [Cupriavidus sp. USMAHM13]AOZ05391.1 hypothetical protein BKK80_05905 [Cupriavidus malaysiensis]
MQTSLKKPLVLATMAAAAVLVVACGGGDDSPSTPTASVSGKAVDFYLSGATVTFTGCNNQTTKTDGNGNFAFPSGCTSSPLTVTGGTDIGTKLAFNGVLQAPAVAYKAGQVPVISPLTTLAVALGVSPSTLAAKLGVTTDPTLVDPMTDAAALKAAVVVQQLIDQITKTLSGVVTNAGGTISASAAAAAAAKAVASAINNTSGTVNLGDPTLVSNAIKGAVVNAQSSLPANLQSSINTVAANVAAIATPLVSTTVSSVSNALSNVTLGGSPSATLTALQTSGALNSVTSSASSTLATTLASAVSSTALTNSSLTSLLSALGNAVATGSPADVSSAASALGANVSGSVVTQISNAITLSNYVQVGNVSINGGTPVAYTSSLTGTGTLADVKAVLTTVGSPFGTNGSNVRAGLHYSYNGNNVDLVIDKVTLTFDGTGALTGATVPANTSYSFNISGGINVSVKATNNSADNLYGTIGSAGALDLPVTTFLSKLQAAGSLSSAQIASLTPKSGGTANVTFALVGSNGNAVVVGTGTGTAAKSTGSAAVTASGAAVAGNGLTFSLSLN